MLCGKASLWLPHSKQPALHSHRSCSLSLGAAAVASQAVAYEMGACLQAEGPRPGGAARQASRVGEPKGEGLQARLDGVDKQAVQPLHGCIHRPGHPLHSRIACRASRSAAA